MELEDKSMERQKLVEDKEELEDITLGATVQSKTPITPHNVIKSSASTSIILMLCHCRSTRPPEVTHNRSLSGR